MPVVLVGDALERDAQLLDPLRQAGYELQRIDDPQVAIERHAAFALAGVLTRPDAVDLAAFIRGWIAENALAPLAVVYPPGQGAGPCRALELGADESIDADGDVAEGSARLLAMVMRGGRIHGTVVECGGLTINRERGEVSHGSAPVPLTAGEYRLLSLLASHRGRCCSRDWLAGSRSGHQPESNSADQLVMRIRRKLREAGCDDPIETVRGVGYRIGQTHAACSS